MELGSISRMRWKVGPICVTHHMEACIIRKMLNKSAHTCCSLGHHETPSRGLPSLLPLFVTCTLLPRQDLVRTILRQNNGRLMYSRVHDGDSSCCPASSPNLSLVSCS